MLTTSKHQMDIPLPQMRQIAHKALRHSFPSDNQRGGETLRTVPIGSPVAYSTNVEDL